MSFGQLTEVGRTKNNTGPKYKIDGQWYYPARSCNTDGLQPGMQVEYEMSWGGNDGKLRILDRVRPAGVPPQSNGNGSHRAAPSQPNIPTVALSPLDDSGMRFVSNLVGSAVMAGKIDAP